MPGSFASGEKRKTPDAQCAVKALQQRTAIADRPGEILVNFDHGEKPSLVTALRLLVMAKACWNGFGT
ncbi:MULTISPECIES: hypothetical protein [unclassified Synechococcus]|uniref:hypothetical protein n=1 Tax=unclassified Synechococcus TaxID=2626047 RepID=UPI00082A9527|nr:MULTISPECIES: hypothetical protein [unclassified Synechococcus]